MVVKSNNLTSVTGYGTHLYIHTADEQAAHNLWHDLLTQGVLTKLNRGNGVSIKPALIFEQKHADILINALSRCIH